MQAGSDKERGTVGVAASRVPLQECITNIRITQSQEERLALWKANKEKILSTPKATGVPIQMEALAPVPVTERRAAQPSLARRSIFCATPNPSSRASLAPELESSRSSLAPAPHRASMTPASHRASLAPQTPLSTSVGIHRSMTDRKSGVALSTMLIAASHACKTARYDRAAELYENIALGPHRAQASSMGMYWVERALSLEKLARYDEVLSVFIEAAKCHPKPLESLRLAYQGFVHRMNTLPSCPLPKPLPSFHDLEKCSWRVRRSSVMGTLPNTATSVASAPPVQAEPIPDVDVHSQTEALPEPVQEREEREEREECASGEDNDNGEEPSELQPARKLKELTPVASELRRQLRKSLQNFEQFCSASNIATSLQHQLDGAAAGEEEQGENINHDTVRALSFPVPSPCDSPISPLNPTMPMRLTNIEHPQPNSLLAQFAVEPVVEREAEKEVENLAPNQGDEQGQEQEQEQEQHAILEPSSVLAMTMQNADAVNQQNRVLIEETPSKRKRRNPDLEIVAQATAMSEFNTVITLQPMRYTRKQAGRTKEDALFLSPVRRSTRLSKVQTVDDIHHLLHKTKFQLVPNPSVQ